MAITYKEQMIVRQQNDAKAKTSKGCKLFNAQTRRDRTLNVGDVLGVDFKLDNNLKHLQGWSVFGFDVVDLKKPNESKAYEMGVPLLLSPKGDFHSEYMDAATCDAVLKNLKLKGARNAAYIDYGTAPHIQENVVNAGLADKFGIEVGKNYLSSTPYQGYIDGQVYLSKSQRSANTFGSDRKMQSYEAVSEGLFRPVLRGEQLSPNLVTRLKAVKEAEAENARGPQGPMAYWNS